MSAAVQYSFFPPLRRHAELHRLGLRVHSNGVATIDAQDMRLTVTPGDWIVTDSDGRRRVYCPKAYARAFSRKVGP